MSWLLIRRADYTIASGPYDPQPKGYDADALYVVECALGYPETCIWSPPARGFLDIPSEAELRQVIDEEREQRKMAVLTVGGAMKLTYAAKVAEVEAWFALGPIGAAVSALTIALDALPAAVRQRRFPYASAQAVRTGATVAQVIETYRAGAARATTETARIEAIAQEAIGRFKAAKTLAAKQAVVMAIDWNWHP